MCDCSQFRAGGIVLIQFFLYSKIFFSCLLFWSMQDLSTKKATTTKKIPSIEICFSTLRSALEERTNFVFSGAGIYGIFWYWAEFHYRASLSSAINNNCLFWESLNWSSVCPKMFAMQETKHLQSSSYILKVMSTLNYTVLRQF